MRKAFRVPHNGFIQFLVLGGAFLFSKVALGVDKDDFYLNGYGGMRLDDTFQAGVTLGYAPFNTLGLGLLVDATHTRAQVSLEPRWFLEPYEFAVALGTSKYYAEGNDGSYNLLLSLVGAYLWALTPSLALRAELRGQYLLHSTSSVLISLGARLIF